MKKRAKFASSDYQYSSLPATRKEVFNDVYRHNFLNIFKCGIALLVSFLPILIFMVIMEVGKIGMTLEFYSEDDLFGVLFVWDIITNVGFSVLSVFVVLILSGICRVIKLLVFQEGIDFFYDFKRGIKENFKQFIFLYLFYIFIYLATYFTQLFIFRELVGIVMIALFHIIFTPALAWIYLSINVYETKVFEHVKNGYFFFFRNVGWSILFLALLMWPFVLNFLFYQNIIVTNLNFFIILIKNTVLVFMMLFYYPALLILSTLFSNYKFDLFINKDNYPEIYRKGLYDKKNRNKA